ncbi:NUDIX domain-containing protein [Candidatus Saccharibacteria bacterium]|nr:MAG: NUDIX domain-containing protein [Candidatus Saccharibacteria bacterium]
MEQQKDVYFVALKLFLRDGDKLLITHDIFGSWDLPGGRFKKDEFEASFNSVIARKMQEELGEDVQYEVTSATPEVLFRVQRVEHSTQQTVRIFALGYEAKYLGGEVKLGDHHDQMEWVDVKTFNPEDYFTGGWLTGVQEYMVKQRTEG